jgi:hypothetical protein
MEYFHLLPDGGCRRLRFGDVMPPRMVAINNLLNFAFSFVPSLTAIPRICMQFAVSNRRRYDVTYQNISVPIVRRCENLPGLKYFIFTELYCATICSWVHRRIAFTFTLSPSPLLHSAITFPTVLKS